MSQAYIPERNDIIWLDFEPTKGKEIGKYRPALVLSSKAYNQQTGLLICCPISTSIRGGATEVLVNNLDQPCVVASSLIRRFRLMPSNAFAEPIAIMEQHRCL